MFDVNSTDTKSSVSGIRDSQAYFNDDGKNSRTKVGGLGREDEEYDASEESRYRNTTDDGEDNNNLDVGDDNFRVLGQIPSARYIQSKLENEKPEYAEENLKKLENFLQRTKERVYNEMKSCEEAEEEIAKIEHNIKWTINAIIHVHNESYKGKWVKPQDEYARRQLIPLEFKPHYGNLERIFSLLRIQPSYLLAIYNYFITGKEM